MAPITSSSTGMPGQIIDDPNLRSLIQRLASLGGPAPDDSSPSAGGDNATAPVTKEKVAALVAELAKYPKWKFQEQADLYEWIKPLDAIDECLRHLLDGHPSLLLIGRVASKKTDESDNARVTAVIQQAESIADVASVPSTVIQSIQTILRFLSGLLRNSYNKMVFNSVAELSDMLAAADEGIATLALETLSHLSTPPLLHRQQQPEVLAHTTNLHRASAGGPVHGRLLSLAKGWGSRGIGLGLHACVATDDSISARSILPTIPGEVHFECYLDQQKQEKMTADSEDKEEKVALADTESVTGGSSHLIKIKLSGEDVLCSPPPQPPSPSRQVEKRRRTSMSPDGSQCIVNVRSTAELFFGSLEKIGGRSVLPGEMAFTLLADIRLARSYHTRAGRIQAVKRRLLAIISILQSHPSQDVLVGYFHAQPELCAELADLVRPAISEGNVLSVSPRNGSGNGAGGPSSQEDTTIFSISEDSGAAVPYEIRMLAVEALTALIARRDGSSGGLSSMARQVNALGELGVAKGNFFGLLPALVRFSLSWLNTFLSQSGAGKATMGLCSASGGESKEGTEEKSAADGTFLSGTSAPEHMSTKESVPLTADAPPGLDLGLVFSEAEKTKRLPRHQLEERMLEFIDVVLTLTSSVVAIPTGTSALTDCGMIPALVQTVSRDFESAQTRGNMNSPFTTPPGEKDGRGTSYADSLLKFILAQAVQILEAAVVTHSSALVAFHELEGSDLLVKRLNFEVEQIKQLGDCTQRDEDGSGDVVMKDVDSVENDKDTSTSRSKRPLSASRRVLLFSLLNCTTVVFHQQENSSSASVTPTGSAQLRKPDLTNVVIDVLQNVDAYGGVLGSLVCTMLSDLMNSDPQTVHYIHSSGISTSFFEMVQGKVSETSPLLAKAESPPNVPPSSELIMAVPNVVSALALTENGSAEVMKANPFPAILGILCSEKYVMPFSRCLLNEMGAIVGTGLDEIMRHVPSLRGSVNDAIVGALKRIVHFGKEVVEKENEHDGLAVESPSCSNEVENVRAYLMQYSYNICQLLEQILHQENQCKSFVDLGGLDLLLELFPLLVPQGSHFLSHVSCLSGPSFAKLSQVTNSGAVTVAIRSIAASIDSPTMIRKIMDCAEKQFDALRSCQGELWRKTKKARGERASGRAAAVEDDDDDDKAADFGGINYILDGVPRVPLHALESNVTNSVTTSALSEYLRQYVVTEWLMNLLTYSIRVASQKSSDVGTGWGRAEREWKKELSSKKFETLVDQFSTLHRCSMQEVCRVRSEEGYDKRESDRCHPPGSTGNNSHPALYRLRIVCAEGAVVRDGIEIDAAHSVGSLEIGEAVEASRRCINSSGVMRYETRSGWVSEQTRGHSREPIAEVLEIRGVATTPATSPVGTNRCQSGRKIKYVECGVADLCSVSASIMARMQQCRSSLFGLLSRTCASTGRGLQFASTVAGDSFKEDTVGYYVSSLVKTLSRNITEDFAIDDSAVEAIAIALSEDMMTNANESAASAHITMYFGAMLSVLRETIVEEKRDREVFNFFLLFSLMHGAGILDLDLDGVEETKISSEPTDDRSELPLDGFIGAIRFVLSEGLSDMERCAAISSTDAPEQKLSRHTAASLPPALALLRRLVSKSLSSNNQHTASILAQMSSADIDKLIGGQGRIDGDFHLGRFIRSLNACVAKISLEIWNDSRLASAPAHIVHPTLNLIADTMTSLQLSLNVENASSGSRVAGNGSRPFLGGVGRGALASNSGARVARRITRPRDPFEPSEDTITRLGEMGFDRDHALEALETMQSNRLEVAMEYCLSHPPPSAETAARRQAEREAAAAARSNQESESTGIEPANDAGGEGAASTADSASAKAADSAMDIEETPAEKEMTGKEKKDHDEKVLNERSRARSTELLDSMKGRIISGALSIIEGHRFEACDSNSVSPKGGEEEALKSTDTEDESTVIVVSQFLIDVCKSAPAERTKLVLETLKHLKSNLVVNGKRTTVAVGKEREFTSLCHAAVLFLRALPRTRSLVLQEGFLGNIMSCLKSTLSKDINQAKEAKAVSTVWPRWTAPAILLLDTMAEPIPASFVFDDDDDDEKKARSRSDESSQECDDEKKPSSRSNESGAEERKKEEASEEIPRPSESDDIIKLRQQHMKQALALNKTVAALAEATSLFGTQNDGKIKANPVFPSYTSLLHDTATSAAASLCVSLLRRCSSSKFLSSVEKAAITRKKELPSSEIVHAVLLLLSRVLRSNKIAQQCLKNGATELICSLPGDCRFDGNSGAATMIMRRMLEDPATLQTLMETDIRAAFAKLSRSSRSSSRNPSGSKISLKPFLQQMTSLICRDPLVFLKAAATSIKIDFKPSDATGQVELLSAEERGRMQKLWQTDVDQIAGEGTRWIHNTRPKKVKSSKRSLSPKKDSPALTAAQPVGQSRRRRSLSPKKDGRKHQIILNGTAANHIASLLFSEMIKAFDRAEISAALSENVSQTNNCTSFLSTIEYLEILADLVLAVPACAASIHRWRYRPAKNAASKGAISHALAGCSAPQNSAVNYVLHVILPIARPSLAKYPKESDPADVSSLNASKAKRKAAYEKIKLVQTSARLLVALVARAGEGRRRVIAELAFALRGGGERVDHAKIDDDNESRHMWALQSWGELCIGLAAPKSTGPSQDGNSTLSFEVVRLMLQNGMAHSIMRAIGQVKLYHPLASSTAAALLRPLEIFSRASVTDQIAKMIEQNNQANKKKSKPEAAAAKDSALHDDSMIEEGFHYSAGSSDESIIESDSGDGWESESDLNSGESSNDEDDDDDESDVEMSSDGSMIDDGEEGSVPSDQEMVDDGDEDDDESAEDDAMDEDELEDNEFFEGEGEADIDLPQPGDMVENAEDWQLLGGNAGPGAAAGAALSGGIGMPLGALGGLLGAVGPAEDDFAFPGAGGGIGGDGRTLESMLSNILRSSDIPQEAVADLEATLGIRISNQMERLSALAVPGGGGGGGDDNSDRAQSGDRGDDATASRPTDRGPVGYTPVVFQITPTDLSHNNVGRNENFNAMEYMYGGPIVGAGPSGRYYSLSSSTSSDNGARDSCSDETDAPNIPASVSTQLFPGGPVAATHVRSPQLPHPLLRDIELGPINALVSNDRRRSADQRARTGSSSRLGGGGRVLSSIMMSDGSGRVVRQSGPRRIGGGGVLRWIEDNRSHDTGMAGEFENAFREVVFQARARAPPESEDTSGSNRNDNAEEPSSGDAAVAINDASTGDVGNEEAGEGADGAIGVPAADAPGQNHEAMEDASDNVAEENADEPTADEANDTARENGDGDTQEDVSEGDSENVASGVSGLRLSTTSPEGGDNETSQNITAAEGDNANATRDDNNMTNENTITAPVASTGDDEEAVDSSSAPGDDTGRVDNPTNRGGNEAGASATTTAAAAAADSSTSAHLSCPPGFDPEVFNSLPREMQEEAISQHQTTQNVAGELDATSELDPEALAALPEDMRREIIEQDRRERERQQREAAPADPANAQEMDNASFLVSLAPELREEVLLTADDTFLNSLPPNIIAEAQVLRERRAFGFRREQQQAAPSAAAEPTANGRAAAGGASAAHASTSTASRKRQRLGRMKVECNRDSVVFIPSDLQEKDGPVMTSTSMKSLVRLMFLLSPVRPHRLLIKVFQNFCSNGHLRESLINTFVCLLNGDNAKALAAVNAVDNKSRSTKGTENNDFPPFGLIGTAPSMDFDVSSSTSSLVTTRQRNADNAAAAIAANIPMSARALSLNGLPPTLAKRVIDSCIHLSKHVPRLNIEMLLCNEETKVGEAPSSQLDQLLDLLGKPLYLKSSTILEHLLCMLEGVCSPLSLLPKEKEKPPELSQTEIDAAASSKKEWLDVSRPTISPHRLKLLCSLLKLEYVKDSSFTRVNTIARRLCRVEANRHFILRELTDVAGVLAETAANELRQLSMRLGDQVDRLNASALKNGHRSNTQVSMVSSTTESKLLRILQSLSTLSGEANTDARKIDGLPVASSELVTLMQSIDLTSLWNELTSCLRLVSILEGVELKEDSDNADGGENETGGGEGSGLEDSSGHDGSAAGAAEEEGDAKKMKSVAGVLTRFLPSIEAFFVINGVVMVNPTKQSDEGRESKGNENPDERSTGAASSTAAAAGTTVPGSPPLVGGESKAVEEHFVHGADTLVKFVSANRPLLNALIRSNPSLLDKGLRAMTTLPGCRPYIDFDVKRQWFRSQVRRLRTHASRRHGSLRLHIRRQNVFEDAYHQLVVRNAEEMRGRLSITFRDEEGVDAGGLSREFFEILAKEMFNANYALFTSTEDGCTFQPNPNSQINPDHLHYFRFVGRIVGKAICDGYLLDAHFTRSLYKHMLGEKPTHHDMEAIDPNYYKNLKLILEHNLDDIGLDLTFSTEENTFGRHEIIDLIPDGRNTKVTDETKEKYVNLVCQHRMTTSIKSQIKAFLEGFHELVRPELVSIFNAKELELLISGLPDIDIFDLKKHTDYQGYRSTDKEIEWFWNVMTTLTRSQKAAFLQFVTGSSKVPLNGFVELQGMRGVQKFSIHRVGGSGGALMSAHTCFNQLDLPVYENEEELKEKLLYAINEGAGGFMFA